MPNFGTENDKNYPKSGETELPGWLQGILLCTIVNITQVNKQALLFIFIKKIPNYFSILKYCFVSVSII